MAETVQRVPLVLEGTQHVSDHYRLAVTVVIDVSANVFDDVLQKLPEDVSDFVVDQTGQALHAAASSQAPYGGFRNPQYRLLLQKVLVALHQAGSTFSSNGWRSFAPESSRHQTFTDAKPMLLGGLL